MKILFGLSFLLIGLSSLAQENQLLIHPNIHLPKDSVETQQLISALNSFLTAADHPNEENGFIHPAQKIETFVLVDELKGIEISGKYKDAHFYKPYLTNVIATSDSTYAIQLVYIGISETTPFYRAGFEFTAYQTGDSFVFASPLLSRTQEWKTKKLGNTIFHYRHELNEQNALLYTELAERFDKKLVAPANLITEFYCCNDLAELAQLIGVMYKADYNGENQHVLSAVLANKKLVMLGNNNASFSEMDPHDLWHDRLSRVVSRGLVNRSIDEGCAYLYGGSWGLSWDEIFDEFVQSIASNPQADWADYKENPVYFKTKGYENSADYIVSALIVQKIEQHHGFKGVWDLLNVGQSDEGNVNYYTVLEKLTGINRKNYNKKVWELIEAEKEKE